MERNQEWLTAPIPVGIKLAYYPALIAGYSRLFLAHRKVISYLGRKFEYDNPATPLNLQNYPHEVGRKVLSQMAALPKTALDVGGNIGQFACTLAYLAPECQIDSIEPNPEIFELLKQNAMSRIKPYNSALGPERGKAKFYYEPNRSGIGSFLKENAGSSGRLKEIEVTVEDDVTDLTGRTSYDLVKIDVEGFEFDVIKALKNVRAKYLYIEVSGGGREKPFSDGELYESITKILGDFNVLYASGLKADSPTYELLLEFV